jgi:hypothetical protein
MAERVNGTIKNATVKAIMYQNIDEMKQDLNKFLIFYLVCVVTPREQRSPSSQNVAPIK